MADFETVHDALDHTGLTGVTGVTASENFITADVTIAAANTFYDGPSLTLAAGTYVLMGTVTVALGSAAWVTAKIWDGTTLYGGAPATYSTTAGGGQGLAVHGYAVLGGSTTVKISVAAQTNNAASIKATAPANGVTNKASHLVAIKIA